jgi:hypothetical protein
MTAWDLIKRWIRRGAQVRLGNRMKILPLDIAFEIAERLRE